MSIAERNENAMAYIEKCERRRQWCWSDNYENGFTI